MPLLASRCLAVIVESHGLTALEMTHVFGGVRELVDSALQGLAARGLVTFDRRTGALPPPARRVHAGSRRRTERAPAGHGRCQSGAAHERTRTPRGGGRPASCPLCGAPLPSDAKGILCDKCAAEVAGS